MLSSQDEACKLEFRSKKISYHSVHSNSFFFFFNNFARTFLKKKLEKILGMVMWRVILVILDMFSHVW